MGHTYRVGISNLLYDVVNFVYRQVNDFSLHPIRYFELLDKLVFDVRYNLIAELLCVGRKGFFDEESAKNPAKTIIDVSHTSSPAFGS